MCRFVLITSAIFFALNDLEAQDPVIKFSSSCRFKCSMKSKSELENIISRFRDFDSAYNTVVRYFNSEKDDAFVLIGRNCPGIRVKQYPTDTRPHKQDKWLGTAVIPKADYKEGIAFSMKGMPHGTIRIVDYSSGTIKPFLYKEISPFDPSKLNILLSDSFGLVKYVPCFSAYYTDISKGMYVVEVPKSKYILELHNRDTILQKGFEIYNEDYKIISLYEFVRSYSVTSKRNKLSLYMYDACTLDKIPVFSNCLIEFADKDRINELTAFVTRYHEELDEQVFYLLCTELLEDVFGAANFVNVDAWIREVLSK